MNLWILVTREGKLTEDMNNPLLQKTSLAYIVLVAVSKLFKVFQIVNKNFKVTRYFLMLLQWKISSIAYILSLISCV